MFGAGRSMPLFRAFGIQVSVDWTWLIALGYVMFVMVGNFQELLGAERQNLAFVYGVTVAFAFFGSIVLHEFGHAVVARRNGIGILGIDLWLLGGLAKMDRDPGRPGVEFRVAAAGPFVTLLLTAAMFAAAAALAGNPADELAPLRLVAGESPLVFALTTLAWINAILLVFNLIPAFPLDGGRIARSVIWAITNDQRRATVVSSAIGEAFGYALVAFALAIALPAGWSMLSVLLFMFMGWSLAQTARATRMQEGILSEARDLTVADVMDRRPVVMPAEASAQRALDEYFWRYRWPWFPVVDSSGVFLGLIEQNAVDRIEEDDRAARMAGDLIAPDSRRDRAVRDDTPLTALLANAQMRDYGSLMAVDDRGMLSGVVTLQQVQRALRDAIARATGQTEPPQAT